MAGKGRHPTGAITTGEVTRIELSYLLKNSFVKMGHHVLGTLTWTNGGSIQIESRLNEGDYFIRLIYKNTNSYSGEVTNHDYKMGNISQSLAEGVVFKRIGNT
jgi:hypothetical protein